MKERLDLPSFIGKKYSRLTILGYGKPVLGTDGYNAPVCVCKCDCGVILNIRLASVIHENTKSCGCYKMEVLSLNKRHGLSHTKLFRRWTGMWYRCDKHGSQSYHYYGGRGIRVCDEWASFEAFRDWSFANGYDEGLQLDRINNNKGYGPDNCRWVTSAQNNLNKRNTVFLIFKGEKKTISEWAKITGIPESTLRRRRLAGLSAKKILSPVHLQTGKKITK